MALCIHEIRKAVSCLVGVNVLRNDACTALSIAAVTGAEFIRVNVLTHAMVTDQGIIQGCAYELSRLRASLGAPVLIFADVMVKHAYPLGPLDIKTAAQDIIHRGGADALVVSGSSTGAPIEETDLRAVREVLPETIIASGSGITPENLPRLGKYLDIIMVGTWIKHDGVVENPVDTERVRQLTSVLKSVHRP
jgi:membrane complex biogenesis BtpA family protein